MLSQEPLAARRPFGAPEIHFAPQFPSGASVAGALDAPATNQVAISSQHVTYIDEEGFMCNGQGRLLDSKGNFRQSNMPGGIDREGYKVDSRGNRSFNERGLPVRVLTGDEACEFEAQLDTVLEQYLAAEAQE